MTKSTPDEPPGLTPADPIEAALAKAIELAGPAWFADTGIVIGERTARPILRIREDGSSSCEGNVFGRSVSTLAS